MMNDASAGPPPVPIQGPPPLPDQGLPPDVRMKIIADTVAGPNLRLWDNLLQGGAVLVGLGIGALVGGAMGEFETPAMLVGGGVGLVLGLFVSGIFLMIYRFVRHSQGRHD